MNQTLNINTDLTFANVVEQREHLHLYIKSNANELVINLSQVKRSDSAGLALMVDALRFGYQLRKKIFFEDIPEQMMSMINFCNLSSLFTHPRKNIKIGEK